MSADAENKWVPVAIAVLAGSIATALVPQTVPILGAIAKQFQVDGAHLGWIVSFPALVCAVGALAFGVVVDRVGDVRLLLMGLLVVILGDVGVSLAPELHWLFAARLLQGFGYVCITVAAPTFIQRITVGETRRAAMAFWAAHTPIGFAAAVYFAARLVAAGLSWRWSFLSHAVAAALLGTAALSLRRIPTSSVVRRSAGTRQVLTSGRAYAVAIGALSSAMIQIGVMTLLPSLLADGHGFSGPQAALVVVGAMVTNWLGAMLVVATPLRNIPGIGLPVSALAAAFFGFGAVHLQGPNADLAQALGCVMCFCGTIGTANALIWSLLPAAVPAPEAAGATAGLITQGSFVGALLGPPTYFWIRHASVAPLAALSVALALLMMVALFAHTGGRRPGIGKELRAVNSH
jgi:predicted MFS family arabinose efflux permease